MLKKFTHKDNNNCLHHSSVDLLMITTVTTKPGSSIHENNCETNFLKNKDKNIYIYNKI